MDSIALAAITVIALVPAGFVAVRIWHEPFAGLLLWVVLLPVSKSLASFAGYLPDEGPEVLRKLTLGDPLLVLTALAMLFDGKGPVGALGTPGRRVVALLGAFCALGIASAFSGNAGPEAFLELATYSWVCVSIVVICRLLGSRRRAEHVLAAFNYAAALACAASVAGTVLMWKGYDNNLLVRGNRVTGLFEAPKQVESFMIAVIPLLCVTALNVRAQPSTRLAHAALVVLAALSAVASGSRLGVILAGLTIWSMLLIASPRAAVLWTCLFLLTAGSAWRIYQLHREEMPFGVRRALSFLEEDEFELSKLSHGRADQLETWYTVFAEHPLLGVGLDQFRGNVPRLVAGGKAQEMHNSYLAVLAEGGLAGALVMFPLLGAVLARSVGFLVAALRSQLRDESVVARALVVSYSSLLLYGMNQYGLRQRYFWFVVALIISLPRIYVPRRLARLRADEVAAAPAHPLAPRWSPQRS
jgi:hypothetical protein